MPKVKSSLKQIELSFWPVLAVLLPAPPPVACWDGTNNPEWCWLCCQGGASSISSQSVWHIHLSSLDSNLSGNGKFVAMLCIHGSEPNWSPTQSWDQGSTPLFASQQCWRATKHKRFTGLFHQDPLLWEQRFKIIHNTPGQHKNIERKASNRQPVWSDENTCSGRITVLPSLLCHIHITSKIDFKKSIWNDIKVVLDALVSVSIYINELRCCSPSNGPSRLYNNIQTLFLNERY